MVYSSTTKSPYVSICIPLYNGETYLRECLDTCVDQDYSDYEIVICDDGSSDKGPQIVEVYCEQHPRIRFYKNEKNLGLVGNWNRCLELAKGEWIKFVFQDDYISKNCLSEFVGKIEEKVQLLVSKRNFILPEQASEETVMYYTKTVRTLQNSCGGIHNYYSPAVLSNAAVSHMAMNFIAEPSLTFFRKKLIDEMGAYNYHLKQICDLEFALRISSKYGLYYMDQPLSAFRIHGASTTSRNSSEKYFEMRYIEPLLLAWHLLFHSHYTEFRKHLNFLSRFKLNLYFKVKSYQASLENKNGNHRHVLFDPLSTDFKEVRDNSRANLFIRLATWVFTK